ncbi:hypothetical protein [Streptomyces sp. NPDC059786]|uniref:hypothetical protein n=1 Tax=Streptomyces sp. NPDC059786 TaxID=3346946 RepID=UPI00365B9A3E
MARFEMHDHDRYRVRKAREELAAEVNLLDETGMARKIGRLEVALSQMLEMVDESTDDQDAERFVERHFPEVSRFLAEERGHRPAPTFGPSGIHNVHGDGTPARAIVRLDLQVSYDELVIAFLVGFTMQHPGRDPESMSAAEVRAVVEGYLASASCTELARAVGELEIGDLTRDQYEQLPALIRAVEDAYPNRETPR